MVLNCTSAYTQTQSSRVYINFGLYFILPGTERINTRIPVHTSSNKIHEIPVDNCIQNKTEEF